MARYPQTGFIAAGASIRQKERVWTVFNPVGDWGQLYMQAHPRSSNVELMSDLHGKRLETTPTDPTFRYSYSVTTRNLGTASTNWDIDM